MKDSEVLMVARLRIELKRDKFVCHAIESSGATSKQVVSLCSWISNMLEGFGTVSSWLSFKRDFMQEISTITDADFEQKIRETRIAWLDWMITYCEAEEAVNVQNAITLLKGCGYSVEKA